MSKILQESVEIEELGKEFGFYWSSYKSIINNIINETKEVQEAIEENHSRDHLQEEIGDILFGGISLCHFLGFNIEETILKANIKVKRRIESVISNAKKEGYSSLKDQSTDIRMKFWDQAKSEESK